jgi:hypothetical protein
MKLFTVETEEGRVAYVGTFAECIRYISMQELDGAEIKEDSCKS